jgi:hypothetical protein
MVMRGPVSTMTSSAALPWAPARVAAVTDRR